MAGSYKYSSTESVLLQDGPRITIEIGAWSADIKESATVGLEFPPPLTISAMIDTGARLTFISPEIAAQCKLRATTMKTVASMGMLSKYPEHAARIRFPGTKLRELDGVPVVACEIKQFNGPRYDCLIGRDILSRWLLTYNGGGVVEIRELS